LGRREGRGKGGRKGGVLRVWFLGGIVGEEEKKEILRDYREREEEKSRFEGSKR
jgi:hypothetical protein